MKGCALETTTEENHCDDTFSEKECMPVLDRAI